MSLLFFLKPSRKREGSIWYVIEKRAKRKKTYKVKKEKGEIKAISADLDSLAQKILAKHKEKIAKRKKKNEIIAAILFLKD